MSLVMEIGSFSRSDHAWQDVAHRLVLGSCIYVKRRYTLLSRYRISYSVVHYSFDISSIDSAIVCNWCASTWEGPKERDYIRFSNSDFYGRLTFGYLGTCTSFFRRVKGMEVSGNHKRNLKPIEVLISVRKLRYCYNLVEKPLEKWFCKTHFLILYQVLKCYDGNLQNTKYKV